MLNEVFDVNLKPTLFVMCIGKHVYFTVSVNIRNSQRDAPDVFSCEAEFDQKSKVCVCVSEQ